MKREQQVRCALRLGARHALRSFRGALLLSLALLLTNSAFGSETVVIGGTGCALGGVQEVARAFQKEHPGIAIRFIPSLGSGGGIKAVLAGSLDLALSARPLTDQEKAEGAAARPYARSPFVFAIAGSAKAYPLTLKQVASIYAGELQVWPDSTPIRLVLRPESDADTVLLKTMSPDMAMAVRKALSRDGMLVAVTDQENADILSTVKGAFGGATLSQIVSEKRQLQPLTLDNVRPGLVTLEQGAYPYSKTFYVITTHGRNNPSVQQFLDYLFAPKGRAILARTGHLALENTP
jgi:phosphate transport system substrate-binding protein